MDVACWIAVRWCGGCGVVALVWCGLSVGVGVWFLSVVVDAGVGSCGLAGVLCLGMVKRPVGPRRGRVCSGGCQMRSSMAQSRARARRWATATVTPSMEREPDSRSLMRLGVTWALSASSAWVRCWDWRNRRRRVAGAAGRCGMVVLSVRHSAGPGTGPPARGGRPLRARLPSLRRALDRARQPLLPTGPPPRSTA